MTDKDVEKIKQLEAESERLREQITASCAREAKLREALTNVQKDGLDSWLEAELGLALPHDDTALKEYGKREYERGWDDGHIAGREKISGLKEYKKKVLLETAERIGSAEFMSSPEASKSYAEYNELRRMAEEE